MARRDITGSSTQPSNATQRRENCTLSLWCQVSLTHVSTVNLDCLLAFLQDRDSKSWLLRSDRREEIVFEAKIPRRDSRSHDMFPGEIAHSMRFFVASVNTKLSYSMNIWFHVCC